MRRDGLRERSVKVDADFEGGSILVTGGDDSEIALALRPDNASDLKQWFCFRSFGDPGERRAFRIEDAGEAEYPDGWQDYRVCASYEGEDWFRVPTRYEDGVLRFEHVPPRRLVTFASFAPYPPGRLRRLVAGAARSERAQVRQIGATLEGRPIPAITFGEAGARAARIWMIARQHPGEAMAAWCAEGVLLRLLDGADPIASALLEEAVISIVPTVNIDGAVRGNHRTNAAGHDLNRSWDAPSLTETPEVFAVRSALLETGVDLFLDIHGEEALPYVFAAGSEGNPSYSPRIETLETSFRDLMHMSYPSFSPTDGYERDAPGEADLSCASNWVGERFDCLSLTLEMPFKDDAHHPHPHGFTPARCRALGRATLEAALLILGSLR